jgi:hypothetical protein
MLKSRGVSHTKACDHKAERLGYDLRDTDSIIEQVILDLITCA